MQIQGFLVRTEERRPDPSFGMGRTTGVHVRGDRRGRLSSTGICEPLARTIIREPQVTNIVSQQVLRPAQPFDREPLTTDEQGLTSSCDAHHTPTNNPAPSLK